MNAIQGAARDAAILVPVFAAGVFTLVGVSESVWRHPDALVFYLLFLGFLFGVLMYWHRAKLRESGRSGVLKDALVLGAVFGAGTVVLSGAAQSTWRGPHVLPVYLTFLAFLFGVLLSWYRGKLRETERSRPAVASASAATASAAAHGWTPGRATVAVGLGAPVGVFAVAWLASLTTHSDPSVIWVCAAAVVITVLLCGTFLMTRLHAPGSQRAWTRPNGKPAAFDPDAFDVVGRRG